MSSITANSWHLFNGGSTTVAFNNSTGIYIGADNATNPTTNGGLSSYLTGYMISARTLDTSYGLSDSVGLAFDMNTLSLGPGLVHDLAPAYNNSSTAYPMVESGSWYRYGKLRPLTTIQFLLCKVSPSSIGINDYTTIINNSVFISETYSAVNDSDEIIMSSDSSITETNDAYRYIYLGGSTGAFPDILGSGSVIYSGYHQISLSYTVAQINTYISQGYIYPGLKIQVRKIRSNWENYTYDIWPGMVQAPNTNGLSWVASNTSFSGSKVNVNSSWKDITAARVYVDGAWKPVTAMKVYQGGAWKDVPSSTTVNWIPLVK